MVILNSLQQKHLMEYCENLTEEERHKPVKIDLNANYIIVHKSVKDKIIEVLKDTFEMEYDFEGELFLAGKETFKDEKDFDKQIEKLADKILEKF